jgi:hypothetical protein
MNLMCFKDVESSSKYFSFVFLYVVSLDGSFFVPTVDFLFLVRCFLLYTSSVLRSALRFQ